MPDLGTKHECTSCSTKFYDMGKAEPICPKCGLNQLAEEEPETEADEAAAKKPKKPKKPKKKAAKTAKAGGKGGDKKPAKSGD